MADDFIGCVGLKRTEYENVLSYGRIEKNSKKRIFLV